MSTVHKIPIVFEGDDSIQRLEAQYGLKLTLTRQEDLDEYTVEGDEPNLVKFLVDYYSNIVAEGQLRFNLVEFVTALKWIEPPLEQASADVLEHLGESGLLD